MAVTTLKHMLVQQELHRGDGMFTIPDSRRNERLMATGRTKHLSTGVKIEKLLIEDSYDPRADTSLKAFVRLLAQQALPNDAAAPSGSDL